MFYSARSTFSLCFCFKRGSSQLQRTACFITIQEWLAKLSGTVKSLLKYKSRLTVNICLVICNAGKKTYAIAFYPGWLQKAGVRGNLWQGNEKFIFISVVSAIRCQLVPPGGHFGKNPLFKKNVFKNPDVFYPCKKANVFSI